MNKKPGEKGKCLSCEDRGLKHAQIKTKYKGQLVAKLQTKINKSWCPFRQEVLQKEFNDIKPITFAYSTKPIGKVVNKKTYPTGIEFTIELDVSDKSEEEIEDLKRRSFKWMKK